MRRIILPVMLAMFAAADAQAWIEIEEDDGDTWDCVDGYCYKESSKKSTDKKQKESRRVTRELGDPLAFSGQNANGNDPLAFPKKSKKSRDPMAF